MVDRLKDNDDKRLEFLFRSEPVADNGFSRRVLSRIRRRIWIRRLTLPAAFAIGAAIAAKPLSQLLLTFGALLTSLSPNLDGLLLQFIPQLSTVMLGALFLAALYLMTRLIDE